MKTETIREESTTSKYCEIPENMQANFNDNTNKFIRRKKKIAAKHQKSNTSNWSTLGQCVRSMHFDSCFDEVNKSHGNIDSQSYNAYRHIRNYGKCYENHRFLGFCSYFMPFPASLNQRLIFKVFVVQIFAAILWQNYARFRLIEAHFLTRQHRTFITISGHWIQFWDNWNHREIHAQKRKINTLCVTIKTIKTNAHMYWLQTILHIVIVIYSSRASNCVFKAIYVLWGYNLELYWFLFPFKDFLVHILWYYLEFSE